jgi:hypothetical protein
MKPYDLDTKEGMANAIAWTTQALTCLNDGGRWVIPRSLTIVTAYPSRKAVQIKDGVVPDPSIRRVIREMGWEIETLGNVTQNLKGESL